MGIFVIFGFLYKYENQDGKYVQDQDKYKGTKTNMIQQKIIKKRVKNEGKNAHKKG